MKKISVVVPCYNASGYLEKCIEHLLQQTIGIENMEIILVDDASTDHGATLEIIMRYEQKYPDTIIAVAQQENLRQGGARNTGIFYAGGEYLIFCDADDWLMIQALEHVYEAACTYDADVVEFRIKNISDHSIEIYEIEKGTESFLTEINTEAERKSFLIHTDEKLSLGSQKKLFRLALLKENHIQFVEHRIFEEPSFMVPVRLFEKKHYFLDEFLYICYRSAGSTVQSDWGEHKWDNPEVWMHLLRDLQARGIFQKYYAEMEYLFWKWGFGLSIKMSLQKGNVLTSAELIFLRNMLQKNFPHVERNRYVKEYENAWDSLMLTLLNLEITDESTGVINQILRKYI